MKRNKKWLCDKHGGKPGESNYVGIGNAGWLCDVCSCDGIKKCECGGIARCFGEAMMGAVTCEDCGASMAYLGSDENAIDLWNSGERGFREDKRYTASRIERLHELN